MTNDTLSANEASKRAGGRRRYNAWRRFLADERRIEIGRLLAQRGFGWGIQRQLAQEVGVHPSTITRDLKKMFGSPGAVGERSDNG